MEVTDVTQTPDFDVLIIGAGVAGCVAGIELAKAGHNVAIIERGQNAGAKNLSGGVFYSRVMEQVLPEFLHEAPLERKITRNIISFLNADSHLNIDYWDAKLENPINAVTVLRSKLDIWLAEKAEEYGVMLMSGIKIDELYKHDSQIIGIKAGTEIITAHIVIVADGANSFLAQESGIRTKEPNENLALGVKSVIALPEDVIAERFNLTRSHVPDTELPEGSAWAVVGDATMGVAGGGFMYTNRESISVGVVLRLDDLLKKKLDSTKIHDHFLNHPAIAPYLKDGEIIEYGSHLTIENGTAMTAKPLTAPGLMIVGDAGGFTLNTGMTIRGMDLAAQSAICAAQVADEALKAGDFSQTAMDTYREKIDSSWLGKDLQTYRNMPMFLENERIYNDYGKLLTDIFFQMYNVDLTSKKSLLKMVHTSLRNTNLQLWTLIKDAYKALRAL